MNGQPIKPQETEKTPQEVEDIFAAGGEAKPRPEIREQPPELKKEAAPEVRPEHAAPPVEAGRFPRMAPPPAAPSRPTVTKSPAQQEIENILSDNLQDIFVQMTPQEQMQFKRVGEETASKIEKLLQDVKVKVKEVLNLIKEWLKLIPGVNKLFLEQEAKIKTDRILRLKQKGKM